MKRSSDKYSQFEKVRHFFVASVIAACAVAACISVTKKQSPSIDRSPEGTYQASVPDNIFNEVVYLNNYDGDTIRVDIPYVHPLLGKNAAVRVKGIDTPEMKSKDSCEREASKRAQLYVQDRLSKARTISLINAEREKYFRILADVIADGKSLGKELVDQGMAVPYDGGRKQKINWCAFIAH